jgi:hypothetical protein
MQVVCIACVRKGFLASATFVPASINATPAAGWRFLLALFRQAQAVRSRPGRESAANAGAFICSKQQSKEEML